MSWFLDLSTRTKLFLGFGAVIIFLVTIAATATVTISDIKKNQREIYESEFANTIDLLNMNSDENEVRLALVTMLSTPERAGKERWASVVKDRSDRLDKTMERLKERNGNEPGLYDRLEELDSVRASFNSTRDTQLIPLIYANKTNEARAISMGVQADRYERMRSITTELSAASIREARRHITESEKEAYYAMRSFLALSAVAVFLAAAVTVFFNRIIARPLKEISGVAERISSGDLTAELKPEERRDEVGLLAKTFRLMLERLQKQTRDVSDAVSVLASSSNEIVATTAQLASGTEQTAVAVTETTTTVEEVKQTANVSSQKARHVSDLAKNAVSVSQEGERLVKETIDGINRIKEQMEYIADTIVRLSENNQAIGEIIASVDDIAEQSNLLAVNASIEAAKVGEHGKGFSVVAQEIKSLAEQSKQATKQVRTILNDIQKASSAAVMATEKGSKAVDATVRQSADTGTSIQELSKSINEASHAVTQIAASNQQQLVGMDQVALAMTNIKQATSQNAASTKQVEVTVRGLQDLGQRLKKLVENYRV